MNHPPPLGDAEQRALLATARDAETPDERRRAVEKLLEDFRGPALAVIHKTLRFARVDRSSIEDVWQAAVLKLIGSGIAAHRGEAAPRSYFLRIVLHAALDLLRARHREVSASGAIGFGFLDPPDPRPSVERGLQLRREREALEACLRELPDGLSRAVALYYLEQHGDCGRCAEELGIRRNAFEQRLSRARAALAACIRARLGDDGEER